MDRLTKPPTPEVAIGQLREKLAEIAQIDGQPAADAQQARVALLDLAESLGWYLAAHSDLTEGAGIVGSKTCLKAIELERASADDPESVFPLIKGSLGSGANLVERMRTWLADGNAADDFPIAETLRGLGRPYELNEDPEYADALDPHHRDPYETAELNESPAEFLEYAVPHAALSPDDNAEERALLDRVAAQLPQEEAVVRYIVDDLPPRRAEAIRARAAGVSDDDLVQRRGKKDPYKRTLRRQRADASRDVKVILMLSAGVEPSRVANALRTAPGVPSEHAKSANEDVEKLAVRHQPLVSELRTTQPDVVKRIVDEREYFRLGGRS
ncbi:MAG: hypothetical protein OXQ90_19210 [Gammaproteobacteria bacterium]|nr:hypothetical protein [Gammaproteobacteria bacterium]